MQKRQENFSLRYKPSKKKLKPFQVLFSLLKQIMSVVWHELSIPHMYVYTRNRQHPQDNPSNEYVYLHIEICIGTYVQLTCGSPSLQHNSCGKQDRQTVLFKCVRIRWLLNLFYYRRLIIHRTASKEDNICLPTKTVFWSSNVFET